MSTSADFSDIQGLVRFGYAHLDEAAYLLLKVKDQKFAKSWLQNAPVSTAVKNNTLPDTALQIAISAKGLNALGVESSVIEEFSAEFVEGMIASENRSRRLGDTGNNHPKNWQWGGTDSGMPDVLLLMYSRPNKLEEYIQALQTAEFKKGFELVQRLETKSNNGKEHFGFVDGISQPKTDWRQEVSTDLHERDRYANLLSLGEVLLGYKNEYGLYTDRPLLDPSQDSFAQNLPLAEDQPQLHDLGKNGSYLVLRQLSQDASGFWQFVDEQASSDTEKREQLANAMVGRAMDGQPLAAEEKKPIQGIPLHSQNHFTYDQDPHGRQCPIGSHVRRANPRTGDYPSGVKSFFSRMVKTLGFKRKYPTEDLVASSRFHRILRRGRTYGKAISIDEALSKPSNDEERGLHFICLGANITRQFEFVQNAWIMSSKFAGLSMESDPLLGNREALYGSSNTNQFTLPQRNRPAQCISDLPQFVQVRGGAYFFMPGLAALKYLAADK